jgi:hypothetical protein
MHKSKKQPLKSDTPAAGRGKPTKALILLSLALILGTLVIAVGQQGGGVANKDIPVEDRFENAVKAREPKFKLTNKLKRKNRQENYVLQGWKSDEEVVSATTYELASAEEAAGLLKSTLDAPLSVPVQSINLTNLGDEAYLRLGGPYSKKGHTNLFVRKGNYLIILSASSPGVAKRFAKHMIGELSRQ